jgi:iron complex outermembrane receptor protein
MSRHQNRTNPRLGRDAPRGRAAKFSVGVIATSGLALLALQLALLALQPALADGSLDSTAADNDSGTLSEIVVTARFKTENLQQTPIAITAISADDIAAKGFVDVTQLANSAPNVEMQENNSVYGKAATAYIRGIGQNDFNYALEPGVAFYVDGVYLGTLLGKNAEGGAISINSVRPKGDDSGYVDVGMGSFGRRIYKGAIDVPVIADQLYLRVSGASDSYDGYQRRVDYFCANPTAITTLEPQAVAPNCNLGTNGGDSTQTARAALRWMPSSSLEVNVAADTAKDRGDPTPNTTLAIIGIGAPAGSAPPWISLLSGYGINPSQLLGGQHPYLNYQGFSAPAVGNSLPPEDNMDQWGTSGTIDWDVGDGIHVKSITGYRWYGMEWSAMQGGGPVAIAGVNNQVEHNQTSEELQVSGHALDHALDWTAGAYYYHGYSYNGGYVDVDFAHFGFGQNNDAKVTDKSAFLHADYKVGDFGFEAGVRYTRESKTVTIDEDVLPVSAGILFVPNLTSPFDLSRVDPKIGVRYSFTPDLMAYASYSTGFKSGGINPRPTSPAGDGIPFGAETAQAYELGVKSEWLNHRLRSNTALFLSNYKNFQIQGEGPSSTGAFINIVETAIGQARIYGIEEELKFEPVRDLLIDVNAGWLHFDTLSLGNSANCNCGGPTLDSQPPGVPEVTVDAGLQYGFLLGAAGKLTPRLDWNYKSLVWNDSPNSSPTNTLSPSPLPNSTPAEGILNFLLTWTSQVDSPSRQGEWSVRGEVTNVTNRFYYLNTLLQPWTLDGVPSPPREWKLIVERRF